MISKDFKVKTDKDMLMESSIGYSKNQVIIDHFNDYSQCHGGIYKPILTYQPTHNNLENSKTLQCYTSQI